MSSHRQRRVLQEITETLRPGDVVNFEARGKNFLMRFLYSQLHRAQRKKFGKNSRYRDIHSVLVLGFQWPEGIMIKGNPIAEVLSVTVPRAIIEPLSINKRTKKVTVCRLKGSGEGFSDEWLKMMREAAESLVGTEYDYGQILAIKLKLQGWPKWFANLFDMGSRRTVCSGGVQYCLLKAWKEWIKPFEPLSNAVSTVISRPLSGTLPNETYPAHFVNNSTFTIVKEWKL